MPRKRTLIIEDDNFTRFMMQRIINTLDLNSDIDIAEDGLVGCQYIEDAPGTYGLVLMDIHMPKFSGIEATKRIRDNEQDPPAGIPIVAVTADAQYHHKTAVEAHGMTGYIAKPISPGELIALIDEYC